MSRLDSTAAFAVCGRPVNTRLRTFIALLLLALWLPATQHCNLEAAGALAGQASCLATDACPGNHSHTDCTGDNCHAIESGAFQSQAPSLQLAAPLAFVFAFTRLVPPNAAPGPVLSPLRTSAPPEIAPSWRFISRAAPPARAPALTA